MTDDLRGFSTVTLVPVIAGGASRTELRLYIPNRCDAASVTCYMYDALSVYSAIGVPRNQFQLEFNRWGMCFNAFVNPTRELRDAVNQVRSEKGLRPCLA
jgi:hypothetical protein